MARIVRRSKSGEPGVGMRAQNWAVRAYRWPIVKKRSVRTLIKRNESKGRTMPEFDKITDQKGVDTGSGFATSVKTVMSSKRAPQPSGRNKRRVKKAGSGPLKRRSRGI